MSLTSSFPASAPEAAARLRPSLAFMRRHPAHWIALGFGSGLSPVAPGTVGTLWGWLSFLLLDRWLGDAQWALLLAAGLGAGWWACTLTARHLRDPDPSAIVWDEILCFWAVLWVATPAEGGVFWSQLWAFVLFRFFDAAKPGPIGWADRHFKGGGWRGGFGILADDIVAAGCTLLVIALGRAW